MVIPIITVDGPSGSGKGTIARMLARYLRFHLLDSGAIYRTVALAALDNNLDLDLPDQLVKFISNLSIQTLPQEDDDVLVSYNGVDVTTKIRTEQCAKAASHIAKFLEVRRALLDLQHNYLIFPGLVADGRDMGTVIFPQADLKLFLTASIEKRAKRRFKQLQSKDITVSLTECCEFFRERDRQDTNRKHSALKPATDAVIINNDNLGIQDTFNYVLYTISKAGIMKVCKETS